MPPDQGPDRACAIGISDGKLVIEPAVGEGAPCKVVLGDGVQMTVNGRMVHERCELLGDEDVVLDLGDSPAANVVSVELDPLELEAVVTVEGFTGVAHSAMDQTPSQGLTIWREVVEYTAPPPLEPRDISAALSAEGVRRGVMAREIAHLIANPYAGAVVVARGVAPGESTDAVITRHLLDECVDNPFHCVRAGVLLATKTPPVPGADGVSVKGDPVPPREPQDPELVAGDGVEYVEEPDGTVHIYAARDGRPVYDAGKVSVATTIHYQGDIDVGTGDVEVFGSIVVQGGVGEERRVWASGTIDISGGIEGAEIEALGGVIMRGPCLHSKVHAGSRGSFFALLVETMSGVLNDLQRLQAEASALHNIASDRGDAPSYVSLVRNLVEQRYLHVRQALRDAAALVGEMGDDYFGDQLHGDLEQAVGVTSGFRDQAGVTSAQFARMVTHIVTAVTIAQESPNPETHIHYLQSSELIAGGDLVLTGQGVFTSDVDVAGDFTCSGNRATIRGGTLTVGGLVRLLEIGAAGSARTVVKLKGPTRTPDRLKAQRVHPGVRVEIQGIEVVFQYERNGVEVGVDEDGSVVWGA